MGTTGKRLFQYAMLYKKQIVLALVLLLLAVSVELIGPVIAKRMIDQNILGIEKTWYAVDEASAKKVEYNGKFYKREHHLAASDAKGAPARVLQAGAGFYWYEGDAVATGTRSVEGGTMTVVSKEGATATYAVTKLSKEDVYGFYKPEIPGLLALAGIYVGLLVLAAGFTYGQRMLLQTSANKIVQRLREDVFAHSQRLSVQYFDNLPAGKIVSRITNDTETIRELYVAVLANFFSGAIYMAAILGALFLLNPTLALIAVPLVPILFVWIAIYRKFAERYNRVIRAKISDINAMINESINGMPIIQAFRRQKATMEEFDGHNKEFYVYQNKMLSLNSITSHNLTNVLRNIIFIIVIWLFWGDHLGSAITVGVLYAFVDYMNRMFQPIVGIVNQLSNLETARISAERVFELMDEPGIDVATEKLDRYKGEVVFRDVTFAYKGSDYVLKNISFEAKQGQTVALVGHTGSGKSSILNLLFRFYDIEKGSISVDGTDIRETPKQLLRQHMGIVLQDPFLFTGTIASNVSLDNPAIGREKVVKALKDVGAYDMFQSLPHGIDEPVIEKGSTLSAGQRQLISFARALAYDPAILILDEATASIDTETEAIIQAALDVLKKGRTTFVIAHRLSTIRQADQILVLDHGEIVERGNHDELMAVQGKYYGMYQLQQGGAGGAGGTGETGEAGGTFSPAVSV
ncbi:ABC transporter ATP-binding protein [Cohnella fermenti]|uniref:ABC transporter ATP-binding protein n=1 Tax=Cohnella fermenti TaxID=2565925 RepID=A0A4S4BHX9_9BACL|nr:ABC transporter ATP-binding protein [Cohnella fermenti]THF74163.1 ABC transporter ATP-binding protein [Cohnella fermenti]